MKRIRFESGGDSDKGKNGLAEYLARNEIETLKAMEGCAWFPRLLNHFRDETEFLVTMVGGFFLREEVLRFGFNFVDVAIL